MLGLESIYNTIYSYFYPEESKDAGSLNEELGTLNGYQIARLSPDMEKDISVQKAIETAQVILLLDIHSEKEMHEANAAVLDQFFSLENDRLLFEGKSSSNGYEGYETPSSFHDALDPISKPILAKGSSWEPDEGFAVGYNTTKFLNGAIWLWESLAAVALDSSEHYDWSQGIDSLDAADNEIQRAMNKEPMKMTAFKEMLQKQSYTERLRYIEELCHEQASLLKKALYAIDINFSQRTISLISKTLNAALNERVQKVWITCGAGHGIGDLEGYADVEKFYAALDEKKISYATLWKQTPVSIKVINEDLSVNPNTWEEDRKKRREEFEDLIQKASAHIIEYSSKFEHEDYEDGYSIAEALEDEMSFQSDELKKELNLFFTTTAVNRAVPIGRAVASLNRIAYWAKKFRENHEAKAAEAA